MGSNPGRIGALGDTLENIEEREMHITASRTCQKLWMVKSASEFKQVWLDCVKCHYWAFKKRKILHRDLSENNILFWRNQKSSGKGSEIKGVLNDWDMGALLSDEPKPSEKHLAGTIPFMAYELLSSNNLPSAHFLRHDLESFLYILMWAIDNYNLKAKTGRETRRAQAIGMLANRYPCCASQLEVFFIFIHPRTPWR
ncbi:hypothetical protein FA15DRAFT_137167 [Coprinopsis marcescibilis]|uniref:Protein kinase domain-containing protein n=1 Tax=Coprinopsis marcescibilis TaxID=230819 RepID=A0A5C3KJC2_COPMA|nr:hypothetical protein FA15DRAFT_137167 [Coprinopsis marcescibilis]